ncbi:MAG: NAD(P)/FAD-dependent oxidoreductase [Phycisphaeraceae bacterium]|nr:NAD(P)/FAD-dependent oxidoreductase [Phycisphaeraceae bacterium]
MASKDASDEADLLIVGAGAAGLMTAVWAGRTWPDRRVVLLDGARKIGAKILVSGGGRCNVTHHAVRANDFNGGSPNTIRKILKRFPVEQTVKFFQDLGVELKREPTGKLFPTTDSARSVLEALLRAVNEAGVQLSHPWRVESIEKTDGLFELRSGEGDRVRAGRLVLATGGRSLPKTGSDGHGYRLVENLGHETTGRIFPALVPLKLPEGHPLRDLSGLSVEEAVVSVHRSTGKRLASVQRPLLCTHFGLSGPAAMDISRHWIAARFEDPGAYVSVNWLGAQAPESFETQLRSLGDRTVAGVLREQVPKRLADLLVAEAGLDPSVNGHHLPADRRKRLVRAATGMRLEIAGDRGYRFAEVTAGGVPLDQIDPKTMASRRCEGLFLVGEICDVDGPIGGFNFQWAWSSGHVAGVSALG